MDTVKLLDEGRQIAIALEPPDRERHLDFPDLLRIAGLGEEFDRLADRALARPVDERIAARLELIEDCVYPLGVEILRRGKEGPCVLRMQVRHHRARRAEGCADLRDHHALAAQSPRNRGRVEAGGTATADQDRVTRVDALVDGDIDDRLDHVLGRNRNDRRGRLLEVDPHGCCNIALDRAARGIEVERHGTTEEELGIEIAEHEARIRDRGLVTAVAVAGRPRHRARALRSDMQHPAIVNPGDGSPARADGLHVHRWEPRHVTAIGLTDPGFARPRDAPAAHEAHVIGRPAGVGDDRGVGALVLAREIAA